MPPSKHTPLSFNIDDILASRMSISPETTSYHQTQVVPDITVSRSREKIGQGSFGSRCSLGCCAFRSPSLQSRQVEETREAFFKSTSSARSPGYEWYNRVAEASSPPLLSSREAVSYSFKEIQQQSSSRTATPTVCSGRYRPPPFFETVERLRRRLYELGSKVYGKDEPPTNRSTQKVWRTLEKYNAPYSLQHYFFVASLSNECFSVVGEIVRKVRSGELAGSRENEVNQSYFNFLYGRSEPERLRLLKLLRDGEIGVKEIPKANKDKAKTSTAVKEEENTPGCKECRNGMDKLLQENKFLQTELSRQLSRLHDEYVKSKKVDEKRRMEPAFAGSPKIRKLEKEDTDAPVTKLFAK